MFFIPIGLGQTELARYTVPRAKRGLVQNIFVFSAANKPATIAFFQYQNADDVTQPFSGGSRLSLILDEITGEAELTPKNPIYFSEKTDLYFRVLSVGSNDTSVDVDFEIIVTDQ